MESQRRLAVLLMALVGLIFVLVLMGRFLLGLKEEA